jgi:zinc protease
MAGRTIATKALGALALAGVAIPVSAPVSAMQPSTWPQQRSDVGASKAVLFGTLPNGLRYAIMRGTVPPGRVSLRLRIDAGSLYESDTQLGLAHFLEHMAFRGSTHVESGEALRMLERLGLAVGADANAFTDFTQTVYKFDLPSADGAKIDTALMLLRETASELTLTDAAFQAERPVVLSEERIGAGANRDRGAAELDLVFHGQRAAARLPIGKADLLRTTGPEPLRQFYRDYYRPERATVIAVGDFDPKDVEARIKAHFADWKNSAPNGADPDYGTPTAKAPAVRILAAAGLSPQLSLAWVRPYDDAPRNKARLRRLGAAQLAMNILSRRLYALASSDNSPFASAGAGTANRLRSAQITTMGAIIKPDQWQRALQALIIAERQITAPSGVSQADLDTAIASNRASLQTRAASYSTRGSNQLADGLVASVNEDDVFTADPDDLVLFEEIIKTITPEDVAAAAREAFSGAGPLIILSGPTAVATEPEVTKALADAQAMSTSTVQVTSKAWPFTDFGTPGKVTERKRVDDLDFTALRFANGTRLNVKQTPLVKDQVLITVRFGNGRQALPKDRAPIDWTIAAWPAGGLKGLSLAELQQIFAGKVHRESPTPADDAFILSAATRPEDLELEMQLLAAYFTAPAWRPEAFDRSRTVLAGMLPQLDTSPGGVMRRELGLLLHSGDRRFAAPTPADVAATHVEDARALFDPQLASGPLEITIVGDVTVDRASQLVASTFGAMAQRKDAEKRTDHVAFPHASPDPVTLRHNGRADQGLAFVAWPIPDLYSNPQRARTLDLLAQVISQRLFDQVRVAQGATYSTRANAEASSTHPGYGYLAAYAETPPDKVQSFYDTLDGIIADLKAKEPSADEFARARAPMLEQLSTARRTNAYWASRLSGSQTEPRQLELVRSVEDGIRKITPADVHKVAQEYLEQSRIWRLRILPNPTPAAAAAK